MPSREIGDRDEIVGADRAQELAHVRAAAQAAIARAAVRRARHADAVADLHAPHLRPDGFDDADAAVTLDDGHVVDAPLCSAAARARRGTAAPAARSAAAAAPGRARPARACSRDSWLRCARRTWRPLIGRSTASCNVVRPGPSPREIHALKRRCVTTAGAWPNALRVCASSAAPPAAAAALSRSKLRREIVRFLLMSAPSVDTTVTRADRSGRRPRSENARRCRRRRCARATGSSGAAVSNFGTVRKYTSFGSTICPASSFCMTSGGRVADAGVLHVDALALLGLERVARVELREAVGLNQLPVGAARQDLGRSSRGPCTVPPRIAHDPAAPVRHLADLQRLADLRAQLERERESRRRSSTASALSHRRLPRAKPDERRRKRGVRLRRSGSFIGAMLARPTAPKAAAAGRGRAASWLIATRTATNACGMTGIGTNVANTTELRGEP